MVSIPPMILTKIIVFQLLLHKISCDCGPAAEPYGAHLNSYRNISAEGSHVNYNCIPWLRLFYDSQRTCTKGKWTDVYLNVVIKRCFNSFKLKSIHNFERIYQIFRV